MLTRNRSLKTIIVAITTGVLCLGLIQMASATEKTSEFGSRLTSTFGSKFVEISHGISMTTKGSVAKLSIKRALKNDGLRTDELSLILKMPKYASITSAKIYDEGIWKEAEFQEKEEADKNYHAEKYQGSGRRLLIAEDGNEHEVMVSPVVASEIVILSYEVEVQMEYDGGYSFPWDLAPNGLETENLSAVRFSSDRAIRLKGSNRFPGEHFILAANQCEEKGFDSSCEIVEFENAVSNDEEVVFSFVTKTLSDRIGYFLVAPDGTTHTFNTEDFLGVQTTSSSFRAEVSRPSIPGLWRFVAIAKEKDQRSPLSEVKAIQFGRTIVKTPKPKLAVANDNRIFILNSKFSKGGIRYGRFQSGKLHYSKIDVASPERLSVLPKNPTMIFLLDSSLSQTSNQLSLQLEMVRSITSHTADEDLVLISYNRKAERVPVAETSFGEDISSLKRTITLGNGSNIGEALLLAGKHIQTLPSQKPVLVYAMTDLLFKRGLTESALLKKMTDFKKNATLHVIEVREDESSFYLERDDGIRISGISTQTSGVSVVASFPMDAVDLLKNDSRELDKETLYLVRPDRIDNVQLSGFGSLNALKEDESFSKADWNKVGRSAELSGQLWSRPFRMAGTATPKSNLHAMRFALNDSPDDDNLSYDIAKRAGVVSEFSSLIKGGKKIRVESGVGQMGRLGRRTSRRIGCGGFHMSKPVSKKVKPDYSSQFSSIAKKCGQAHESGSIFRTRIETTKSEIVEVNKGQPQRSPYQKCVVEGVWDTHLTADVNTGEYTIAFNGIHVSHE